jgi:1-deoxy-D-xylulose-5-phosphate synthase
VLSGGFGSAVLEWINQSRLEGITLTRFGFPDRFIEQGCKTDLMHRYELTPQAVCARILAAWPGRRSKSAGPSGTPADKRGA